MNRKSWFPLLLALVLLFSAVPLAAADSEQVSFRMEVNTQGDQVVVTVQAKQASDVFAYDLILQADDTSLKLLSARSLMTGFPVGPLTEEGQIRFAATKTGHAPGSNGDVDLASFTFERLKPGAADIRLVRVQLVNSELDMDEYKPDLVVEAGEMIEWTDIKGHWAEAEILRAVKRGIVNGYEDQTFRPDREVSRAEFAAMFVRALELPAATASELQFADKDLIPTWAHPYISAAVKSKLITGYEDGTFRADQPIKREEIATIIARSFGGTSAGSAVDLQLSFADVDDISEWARPYIAEVVHAGLMGGRGDQRFAPKQLATRAEAVVVLLRMISAVKEE